MIASAVKEVDLMIIIIWEFQPWRWRKWRPEGRLESLGFASKPWAMSMYWTMATSGESTDRKLWRTRSTQGIFISSNPLSFCFNISKVDSGIFNLSNTFHHHCIANIYLFSLSPISPPLSHYCLDHNYMYIHSALLLVSARS